MSTSVCLAIHTHTHRKVGRDTRKVTRVGSVRKPWGWRCANATVTSDMCSLKFKLTEIK